MKKINYILNKSVYKKNLNYINSFNKLIYLCKGIDLKNVKITKEVKNHTSKSNFMSNNSFSKYYEQYIKHTVFYKNEFIFSFVIAFYKTTNDYNNQISVGLFLFDKPKGLINCYYPSYHVYLNRKQFIDLSNQIDYNFSPQNVTDVYNVIFELLKINTLKNINISSDDKVNKINEQKIYNFEPKEVKQAKNKIIKSKIEVDSIAEEIKEKIHNAPDLVNIREKIKQLEEEINKLKIDSINVKKNLDLKYSELYKKHSKGCLDLEKHQNELNTFMKKHNAKMICSTDFQELLNLSSLENNSNFDNILNEIIFKFWKK